MADNRIRILLEAVDKISGPLAKVQDRFDGLGKSKGFKSFAQGVGIGAGIGAWNLIGDAASRAIDYIGDSIDAASRQREAMALNTQVFKGASDEIDKWSNTTARALGLAKAESIDYAAKFGNTLKAAGLDADELAGKSIELTKRAADLGSAFNVSGEEVATAIRSGLVGESEPMRRFGVLLNEATVKAKGMSMGLADANGELSAGAKVLARYQLILEGSSDSAGMFGRDLGSLADQQKRLTALAEDTSAKFGNVLLPIVVEFQTTVIKAMDNASMSIEDLEKAAAKGSWGARAHLNALAAQAGKMSVETATAMNDLKDDSVWALTGKGGVTDALDDTAGATVDLKDESKKSLRSAADAFTAYKDSLVGDAHDAIDDAFDPIIAHDTLTADNAEISAARRIIASGKATKAEIRDAEKLITETTQDTAEQLVVLAEAGMTNSTAYKEGVKNLEKYIARTSGPTKRHLQDVLTYIHQIERAGKVIPLHFVIDAVTGTKHFGGLKAGGGPVDPRHFYVVGEQGPEVFVPNEAGTIMPQGATGGVRLPTMGDGGGSTVNLTYAPQYSTASPSEAQAFMRAIVPDLTRELRRQRIL